MIRRYMVPLKAGLVLSDALSAFVLFPVLATVRFHLIDPNSSWNLGSVDPVGLAAIFAILWVGALWTFGLYRLRTHWTLRSEIIDVLRATVMMLAISLSALYLLDLNDFSRIFVVMLAVAQPAVTVASRAFLRLALTDLRRRGHMSRRMLIIGSGPEAEAFANQVEQHRELGLRVMGHLSGPGAAKSTVSRPVVGTLDDIEDVLRQQVVDEVAVCLPPADWSYVEPATRICEEEGRIVRVAIPPLNSVLAGGRYEQLGGTPIVSFQYGPDRAVGMGVKRTLDVVISGSLLVMLSPVFALIAAYIRMFDDGPVLFRQQRVGLHGRLFTCLKFRTMVPDAEARYSDLEHLSEIDGPAFKMTKDPRTTRIGARLRKTSLDELPQLINVLRGEMSIVGPRPAPPREVDLYSVWHRRRLTMRPGLTGLWQVAARSEESFDRRVSFDLDYIDRWSLLMDLKIMLRTIPAVVSQEGR